MRDADAGDLWAPLRGAGLAHSIDSGAHFRNTVNGVRGVYRSRDRGASWLRINDDAHRYGGPGDGQFIAGDMHTFGVVYMRTPGRGIAVGSTSSSLP